MEKIIDCSVDELTWNSLWLTLLPAKTTVWRVYNWSLMQLLLCFTGLGLWRNLSSTSQLVSVSFKIFCLLLAHIKDLRRNTFFEESLYFIDLVSKQTLEILTVENECEINSLIYESRVCKVFSDISITPTYIISEPYLIIVKKRPCQVFFQCHFLEWTLTLLLIVQSKMLHLSYFSVSY